MFSRGAAVERGYRRREALTEVTAAEDTSVSSSQVA